MKITEYKAKAWKYKGKVKACIEYTLEDMDKWENDLQFINRKLAWNKWLARHMVEFAPWDYSYNINLFADSLEQTGRNILENGNHVNHVKDGRRALYAAQLLRNSYEDSMYTDKALDYRHRGTRMFDKKLKNGLYEWTREDNTANVMGMDQQEYDVKMSKIAYNRCWKQDESKWEFAWNIIKKYARKFWD